MPTPTPWQTDAASYRRDWGGRAWAVRFDAAPVGLRDEAGGVGPLLGLGRLADRSRSDDGAFGTGSLVGHEVLLDRVEAVYEPAGWPSLRVRAAWAARGDAVIDLEVQAQAFTVGDLESVEVGVTSRLEGAEVEELAPLDESRLASLRGGGSTLPIRPGGLIPPLLAEFGPGGPCYVEIIHPDDGIRRELDRAAKVVRYALFGYDLERGVIVRGRLRGLWFATRPDEAEVTRRVEEFLKEPPPLGT